MAVHTDDVDCGTQLGISSQLVNDLPSGIGRYDPRVAVSTLVQRLSKLFCPRCICQQRRCPTSRGETARLNSRAHLLRARSRSPAATNPHPTVACPAETGLCRG